MNIYIYGSKSFKKDVHDELDHSNIKFKLDDNSAITDVKSLDDLKYLIENNNEDIFLIDDAKIIRKDAYEGKFTSKLKFLIPKDGIEEEFLFEHGIGDISFDSITELAKHITDKIQGSTTSDDSFDNRDEIHDSISEIVNDAYSNEDETIPLDDELSELLVSNDLEPHSFENELEDHEDEIELEKYNAFDMEEEMSNIAKENDADELLDELMHLDISNDDFEDVKKVNHLEELESLTLANDEFETTQSVKKKISVDEEKTKNLDFEKELENLDISNEDFETSLPNEKIEQTIGNIQGDYEMATDFSSLDDISESDILAALNGEEVAISDTQVLTSTKNEPVSVSLNNTDDISELLSKLLKNKTLEITVKIKE